MPLAKKSLFNMKNTNLLLGLFGVGVLTALIVTQKKDTQQADQDSQTDPTQPEPVNPSPVNPAPLPLNRDLVLKRGSRGSEVKELQRLLAISRDGVFGPVTESKLLSVKGKKEISLNEYAQTPNTSNTSGTSGTQLRIGDGVVAVAVFGSTMKVYGNTMSNGNYHNTGKVFDEYRPGEYIGKIISMNADKSWVVIEDVDVFGNDIVWAKIKDVKRE